MKYRVLIEQDEDGVFVAQVPALPGCVSQGTTRAEALSNVQEAIAEYLDSLRAHAEPIPPSIDEEFVNVAVTGIERNAEGVLKKALTLPETDRACIAEALLESLQPAQDADVEAAWRQEVTARVAALDAREVETVPWEEVRDRLSARLREPRAS